MKSQKFVIKKWKNENGRISYTTSIKARNQDNETVGYANLPVTFKQDNKPDENLEAFLIDTDDYFLSGYVAGQDSNGHNITKVKIMVLNYTIARDYTGDNATERATQGENNAAQASLEEIPDEDLPF